MKTIVIDFDGTCVAHDFPRIGADIGAVPVLKALTDAGHRLILYTMRSDVENPVSTNPYITTDSGDYLTQAVNWFSQNDIPLYGIQINPDQHTWTHSPKPYGDIYIDDSAMGAPLRFDPELSGRPYINWVAVERILKGLKYL